MAYDIFELKGTPAQNAIVLDALQRCDFPWEKLVNKLQSQKGKTKIPVEWADLSAYAAQSAKTVTVPVGHEDHKHDLDHDHGNEEGYGHHDVKTDEDEAHGIAYRSRVLGLAWYSGKVSLDTSMESNPELAKEVFLSEGAHMVDFFYMTDQQRNDIFNAFHGSSAAPAAHGHDWFDQGDYYTWVGEAFMGGFVKAYSNLPVTIPFVHPPTAYTTKRIREILTPGPATTSEPPVPSQVFVARRSPVFHKTHRGIKAAAWYNDREQALAAGKRPCTVCKA